VGIFEGRIHPCITITAGLFLLFLRAEAGVSFAQEPERFYDPGSLFVYFFKEFISPVDGDRCPSAPTCSAYSIAAFKKHGFFVGWIMTVDRLIHEGEEELKVSPIVKYPDRPRIFDPVENNDFWWYEPSRVKSYGR